MTFTRWGDELRHCRTFLLVTVSAILELLIENYFVWCCPPMPLSAQRLVCTRFVTSHKKRPRRVVAASNKRKYDPTDIPLQDNIAIFFREWMQTNSIVKWLVTWRWCSISNMVMVFVCMCNANIWDQVCASLARNVSQLSRHDVESMCAADTVFWVRPWG
jgi:hypothetical protein